MRSLLLSSLLLILFAGCRPSIYPSLKTDTPSVLKPIFSETKPSYLYKAKIDILSHYLSGLLFIKPTGVETFRLVFTTELGLTFFDIELAPASRKVYYCMEKLNKKIVLNTLEKDMRLLLMNDLADKKNEWFTDPPSSDKIVRFRRSGKIFDYYFKNKEDIIYKIENIAKSKVKISVDVKDYQDGIPYLINIKHHNFKFNIALNYLEKH